jgi:hypothetical protein
VSNSEIGSPREARGSLGDNRIGETAAVMLRGKVWNSRLSLQETEVIQGGSTVTPIETGGIGEKRDSKHSPSKIGTTTLKLHSVSIPEYKNRG